MKRKNVKIALVVLLGLVLCGGTVHQKSDCQKKTEKFLAGVLKGEVDKSYDELLLNTLMASKAQMVKMLKEQTRVGLNMYGELLGYEFIKQQQYGDSVVRLVYVLKCEQHPLTWEFHFYKAVSDWKLANIQFNDKFDLLSDK